MADEVKCVQLKRSESYGFGFSILGGAGSDLPPIIYDIIESSPAAVCGELEAGDVILEVNDREVVALTTKEVLKCLRLSSDTVNLKLKRDASIKEKVKKYLSASNDMDTLKKAITQEDLDGVREVIAKRSPINQGIVTLHTNSNGTHENENIVNIPPHPSTSAPGRLESEGFLFEEGGTPQRHHSGKHGPPRFETFMMTGDLILNLNAKTSASGMGLIPKTKRIDCLMFGQSSTPASPEESDLRTRSKAMKRESPAFCSPVADKKPAFGYVRTSKSEDHLHPKDSLTTVNIDIDDDVASSLNTLLDTRPENSANERIVWTYNAPVSQHESSLTPSPQLSPTPTSSPVRSPTSSRWRASSSIKPSSPKRKAPPPPMYTSESSPVPRRDRPYKDSIQDLTNGDVLLGSPSNSDDFDRLGDFSSELSSPYEERSTQLDSLRDEEWVERLQNKDPIVSDDDTSVCPVGSYETQTCILDVDMDSPQLSPIDRILPFDDQKTVSLTQKIENKGSPKRLRTDKTKHIEFSQQEVLLEINKNSTVRWDSNNKPLGNGELSTSDDKVLTDPPVNSDEESQKSSSPPPDDDSDIESIHSFHYSPKAIDMPSASRLAKRLYYLEGFKKSDVSRHLSKNNEFSRVVAEEYLRYFDFTNDTLDIALRKFLRQFSLTGETQERERVLVHFSKRFLDCNPGTFNSQDAVHTLTCALMLLNTDLHGQNMGRKMTCAEFIENLSELNDGENFPKEVLKALYQSIKTQPLEWAMDDDEYEEVIAPAETQRRSQEERSAFIGHNPFLEVVNTTVAKEYKKGYVMRKCCIEPSGKKTPFGKRGWKMFYATLKDLVLYLHKDEHGFKKNQLYDNLHNSIRVHHALATKAVDYVKKQHVFRLQTAEWAEYLFQTSDSKELQSWIDTINFVAASISAPPLAGAVGSQKKFQRPLLPCSHTKLNLREQLLDHEQRVTQLEHELEEHHSYAPDKSAKSRVIHDYQEKEIYLQHELKRYKTYAYLLRSKIVQHPELEPSLTETSIGEVDEKENENGQREPNLTFTASGTTLSESANNTNAKKNITDRYSYRAAIYSSSRGEDYV